MTLDQYFTTRAHKWLAGVPLPPTYERVVDALLSMKNHSAAEAVLRRMTTKGHSLTDLDMDTP